MGSINSIHIIIGVKHNIFDQKKAVKAAGDMDTLKAFNKKVFPWRFVIIWKQVANHNKRFLRNQCELLEKFKITVTLASAPGHPVTLPASSGMPTQGGGVAVGLDGSKGARTKLIPV